MRPALRFPQQGKVSAAGKGGGLSDPRGSVLLHSVDYVLMQRPRVACFENVKGLVNKNNRPVLDALVDVLRSAGYKCNARVLNTCTHGGIPHHRPRVYVVAVLKNRLQTPFDIHTPPFISQVLGEECLSGN